MFFKGFTSCTVISQMLEQSMIQTFIYNTSLKASVIISKLFNSSGQYYLKQSMLAIYDHN